MLRHAHNKTAHLQHALVRARPTDAHASAAGGRCWRSTTRAALAGLVVLVARGCSRTGALKWLWRGARAAKLRVVLCQLVLLLVLLCWLSLMGRLRVGGEGGLGRLRALVRQGGEGLVRP